MEHQRITTTKALLIFLSLFLSAYPQTLTINRKVSKNLRQTNCTRVGPNNQTIMGLGNCFQNLYYINIEIGTPPQTLAVDLDTGSNTLWVPTQQVTGVTPIFDTTKSSTFTNTSIPGGVQYLDGSGISGTYGTDIFNIQGSLINITTQYLWVTSEIMNLPNQVQGLIGMGFTSEPNFLDIAYRNGQISSPIFALQILNQSMNSSIYYNKIPQSILNKTIFVPVFGNNYWQVRVLNVQVGGIDLSPYASNIAVIDSGTSLFYINYELYSQIINKFFSNCQIVQNTLICSCSSARNWPDFTFSFENVLVSIKASQYTYDLGNNFCTPLFDSIPGFNQILLGDVFFRGYIITFDKINKQIGFNGEIIVPVQPIYISDAANAINLALMSSIGVISLLSIGVCFSLQKALRPLKDSYKRMK